MSRGAGGGHRVPVLHETVEERGEKRLNPSGSCAFRSKFSDRSSPLHEALGVRRVLFQGFDPECVAAGHEALEPWFVALVRLLEITESGPGGKNISAEALSSSLPG
ncbi:MAG: hypothetical protein AAF517_23845 [Planctomycetota bacterium]